jgi:hypothetical protein
MLMIEKNNRCFLLTRTTMRMMIPFFSLTCNNLLCTDIFSVIYFYFFVKFNYSSFDYISPFLPPSLPPSSQCWPSPLVLLWLRFYHSTNFRCRNSSIICIGLHRFWIPYIHPAYIYTRIYTRTYVESNQ